MGYTVLSCYSMPSATRQLIRGVNDAHANTWEFSHTRLVGPSSLTREGEISHLSTLPPVDGESKGRVSDKGLSAVTVEIKGLLNQDLHARSRRSMPRLIEEVIFKVRRIPGGFTHTPKHCSWSRLHIKVVFVRWLYVVLKSSKNHVYIPGPGQCLNLCCRESSLWCGWQIKRKMTMDMSACCDFTSPQAYIRKRDWQCENRFKSWDSSWCVHACESDG